MSYYDEEFYYEPTEFDLMFNELKGNLTKSIKDEYITEMERLRKENAELQEVKINFDNIKNDYDRKKRELEYEYQNLKSNVRRERLNELLKDLEVELYTVGSTSKSKPKCNKCDEKRRIHFKTPSGKDSYEMCECDKKISIYEPIPTLITSFSIRDGKGNAWYKVRDRGMRDEYLYYYDDSISGQELITDESQFHDKTYAYKTLFKTEELAQKFCDLQNKDKM
jgi:hypothetical protein